MNLIHITRMRPLPPFDALLAFDTVLRLGSMTAAAAELGVTQSAVSHRLRRRLHRIVGCGDAYVPAHAFTDLHHTLHLPDGGAARACVATYYYAQTDQLVPGRMPRRDRIRTGLRHLSRGE